MARATIKPIRLIVRCGANQQEIIVLPNEAMTETSWYILLRDLKALLQRGNGWDTTQDE